MRQDCIHPVYPLHAILATQPVQHQVYVPQGMLHLYSEPFAHKQNVQLVQDPL